MSEKVPEAAAPEHSEEDARNNSMHDLKAGVEDFKASAIDGENEERNMTVLQAVKAYPMASFWAFVMSCCIIMESYDVFLINNFVALDAFKNRYGVVAQNGDMVIDASWSGALSVSGQLGAMFGVFIAGPLTSWIGYRWATIIGLMALNAFIFVFYYGDSLPVFFVAQILEGLPWGIFIANAPAYCSEIVPIQLRAPCTQMLQMFWAIGSIVVQAVTYSYQSYDGEIAYRLPIALQWMFPTPLAVLIFFAPESPWWLVRKGKLDRAAKSVQRLGRATSANTSDTVAMMRRTVELESNDKSPSYLELFKGTDLRRTLIVSGVYAAQNLTGNLIANQAVYFFTQAGIESQLAFGLGLIVSGLQTVAVMLSWILTTFFGRRPIYLWGSAANTLLLICLGIAGSVPLSTSANLAQASLGLIISVGFTLGPAPVSWVVIGETSAIRLRPLTTGFGRAVYYIVQFPCIYMSFYMLGEDYGNMRGKCGYVWGATGFLCLVTAYFHLPEMKNRSYREIDIMFKRRLPARQWRKTTIDDEEDE